jgi:drug/metabolite transporter (DMT)-like permease
MTQRNGQVWPVVLLLVVTVVWGTTFFIVKDTVEEVDPYQLVFVRTTLAALPLFGWLLLRQRRELLRWTNIRAGAILGALMAVMYTSQSIGLQFTSGGHSAFITGIAVVLVPLVMYLFYQYKLNWQHLGALAVVGIGLFLLSYDTQTSVNRGDLITLLTALSAALHITQIGRMVRKHDLVALVAWQFLFAAVFNLGIYLVRSPFQFQFSVSSLQALVYLGFVGTLFCYGASSWAQKYVGPVTAALIFSLEPVFAAGFSYWFSGEVLTAKELGGSALILTGILLYELPVRQYLRGLKTYLASR